MNLFQSQILDDMSYEKTESFTVELSNITGGGTFANGASKTAATVTPPHRLLRLLAELCPLSVNALSSCILFSCLLRV